MITEILYGVLGNLATHGASRLLRQFTKTSNHDLDRAVVHSFRVATGSLATAATTEVERRAFQELADRTDEFFRLPAEGVPQSLMQAILYEDEASIAETLWTCVGQERRGRLESIVPGAGQQLPAALLAAFGETLKDDRHRKAWISYQRTLLQELLQTTRKPSPDATVPPLMQTRLDTIAKDASLIDRLTEITAESLAELREPGPRPGSIGTRLEEHLRNRTQPGSEFGNLLKLTEQALSHLEQNGLVVNGVTNGIIEVESGLRALAQHGVQIASDASPIPLSRRGAFQGLLERHAVLFGGRDADLARLNELVRVGGYVLLAGPAGCGKTSLLANFVRRSLKAGEGGGSDVMYCFVNRAEAASSPAFVLAAVAEQLCSYYGLRGRLPQDREGLEALVTELLGTSAVRSDTPFVLVIDGMDEADVDAYGEPFLSKSRFFPPSLPPGKTVVATTRDDAGDLARRLELASANATIWSLGMLESAGIADVLRQSGEPALRQLADDAEFVRRLRLRTDGLPLYLRYLIEDWRNAPAAEVRSRMDLAKVIPQGFASYIARNARDLSSHVQWRDFLGLLTAAPAPLPEDDLLALTGMSQMDLDVMPHEVRRWLFVRGADGKRHYAYQHPLIRDGFALHWSRASAKYGKRLVGHCMRWQETHSRFALAHLADLLARDVLLENERGSVPTLYALARDDRFLVEQATAFPDEPELPLKTIRAALHVATLADDPRSAIEFMLGHARRHMGITQESPLEALRAGSPERALALADFHEGGRYVLWHLVIAWEATSRGQHDLAAAVIERMDPDRSVRLGGLEHDAATQILRLLQKSDVSGVQDVVARVLSPRARLQARKQPGSRTKGGRPDDPVLALAQILTASQEGEIAWSRIEALCAVASAIADTGDRNRALSLVQRAKTILPQCAGVEAHARAQEIISVALARLGFPDDADMLAHGIAGGRWRFRAFSNIAAELVLQGDATRAQQLWQEVLSWCDRAEPSDRATVLSIVSRSLSRAGSLDPARSTANAALAAAREITPRRDRSWPLTLGATALVEAQGLESHVAPLSEISEPGHRAWLLAHIVARRVESHQKEGLDDLAERVAGLAERFDARGRLDHMGTTALARTRAALGDVDGALRLAQRIHTNSHRNILSIAQTFAQTRNLPGLQKMMTLTAFHLGAAYRMVGLLAGALPTPPNDPTALAGLLMEDSVRVAATSEGA